MHNAPTPPQPDHAADPFPAITTDRLILRRWEARDLEPFHAMSQDAEVMRFIGEPLSIEDCEIVITRLNDMIAVHGHSFWALERREDGAFLGFCGLKPGPVWTPVEGEIEIGWRLASSFWRMGYAQEAARATLAWAWANLTVAGIVAITVYNNDRSRRLMERLGMRHLSEADFEHPGVPEGSALRPHVTYRIDRPA
jgi:RimJ/RimL family protein N-acetyltransferase